jgi:hypothetical protein
MTIPSGRALIGMISFLKNGFATNGHESSRIMAIEVSRVIYSDILYLVFWVRSQIIGFPQINAMGYWNTGMRE